MTDLAPGDSLIGGLGHIDIIQPNGTLVERRPIVDALGKPLQVNGIAVSPSGHYQLAASPPGETINRPHDIAYLPDGSGYIEIVQASPRSARLWKLDLAGNRVGTWTIETDDGWTTGLLRLDVAPDGKTVYYTDSGRTIFRFDIGTDVGPQLTPFAQLPTDSPNIYAGFTLLPDGGLVIAMSKTGDGPRNAVCPDADPTMFWTDGVDVDGQRAIYKRKLADGSDVLSYPVDYNVACIACDLALQTEQGVNSFCYDPNTGSPPGSVPSSIDQNWVDNILALSSPNETLLVRCGVVEPLAGWAADASTDPNVAGYDAALAVYRSAGVRVFVLFPPEFHLGDQAHWNDPLDGNFTNAYITEFSDLATSIAGALHAGSSQVSGFIVWNEPNNDPTLLLPENFGALLYQCWNKLNASIGAGLFNLYWGGIDLAVEGAEHPDPVAECQSFVNDVYTAVSGPKGPNNPWPWCGVNVHVHRLRTIDFANSLFQMIDDLQAFWNDPAEVIVGEWGATVEDECAAPGSLSALFFALARCNLPPAKMFLFSHPEHDQDGRWALIYYTQPPGGFSIMNSSTLYVPFEGAVRS